KQRSVTGEREGMSRIMSRIVNGHRARKADAINEKRAEQDGEHGRQDGARSGGGFGGSRRRVDHRQLRLGSARGREPKIYATSQAPPTQTRFQRIQVR